MAAGAHAVGLVRVAAVSHPRAAQPLRHEILRALRPVQVYAGEEREFQARAPVCPRAGVRAAGAAAAGASGGGQEECEAEESPSQSEEEDEGSEYAETGAAETEAEGEAEVEASTEEEPSVIEGSEDKGEAESGSQSWALGDLDKTCMRPIQPCEGVCCVLCCVVLCVV
jgi:hypothetical protein